MSAMSLNEQALSDRLEEMHARLAKLEEKGGSSSGVSSVTARVKSVEGDVVALSGRLDEILAKVSPPATSTKK